MNPSSPQHTNFEGNPKDRDEFLKLVNSPQRSVERAKALSDWREYKQNRQRKHLYPSGANPKATSGTKKTRVPSSESEAETNRPAFARRVSPTHVIARVIDLRGIAVNDVCLGYVDLRGVRLDGARFGTQTMAWYALKGALFENASLENADLSGARLMDADFTDANLTGAILDGANLARANLTGATLTNASRVPISNRPASWEPTSRAVT